MNVKEKMCECLLNQVECTIIQSDLEKRLFVLSEKLDKYNPFFTVVMLVSDSPVPMYGFSVADYDSYYPVQILATPLYDDANYCFHAIIQARHVSHGKYAKS